MPIEPDLKNYKIPLVIDSIEALTTFLKDFNVSRKELAKNIFFSEVTVMGLIYRKHMTSQLRSTTNAFLEWDYLRKQLKGEEVDVLQDLKLTAMQENYSKDDFSTKLDNLKSEEILSYINDFCAKNNINYTTLSLNLNMSYGFIAHLTHTKKISKAMRGLILRYFEILEMKKALSLY
ncbi:hypothetical protein [Helicobacter sp. 11S02629-2]|uniref:hypothetical protein n=1 Tax=Helicobacter sp. 11S02629-2 TaxID=1476195 RepID=UPI000BA5FD94|nr:hypothetical protein [Helicobacter sp. 11S02629-2]PAF41057.1 hypothetical protein BKH40_08535 [Helicobacter sp. 11S02629-2]